MADFSGADVEQLRGLSQDFSHHAADLEALTARLGSRISSVAWTGPDAQRFRAEWHDRLLRELKGVINGLRDASHQTLSNARQQEETSRG